MRIYIFAGYGGKLLSFGMASLVHRLSPYGVTTFHDWQEATWAITDINGRPDSQVVVIGYSQGAVNLGWLEHGHKFKGVPELKHRIDLGIAYDPRGSDYGLADVNGDIYVRAYDRLVCYRNSPGTWTSRPLGYIGPGTVTIPTTNWHPTVQFDGWLHDNTVREVAELAQRKAVA